MSLLEHDRTQLQAPLPAALSALLERVFSAAGAEPSESDTVTAWTYLGELRTREYWLACDCRGDAPAPILVPRRKPGRMELVRLSRQHHEPGCPFHNVRSVQQPREPAPEPGFPVLLMDSDLQHEGVVVPRLQRVLSTAIERAQLHQVGAQDLHWHFADGKWHVRHVAVPELYERFGLAARSLPRPGGEPWEALLARHPKALHALRERILASPARAGAPRHGLFVGLFDDLGDNRKGWTERSAGQPMWLSFPTVPRGGHIGPFLGAAVHAQNDRGQVRGVFGVAQAVFSRGLPLPISGPDDRDVAQRLLQQMRYWRKEHGVDVTLACPMHSTGAGAEPSFVLTATHGAHLAIVVRHSDPTPARLLEERVVSDRVAATDGGLAMMLVSAADLDTLPVKKKLSSAMLRGIPRAGATNSGR